MRIHKIFGIYKVFDFARPRLIVYRLSFTRYDNRSRRDAFSLVSYDWNVLLNWKMARYSDGSRIRSPMRFYYGPTDLPFIVADPNDDPAESAACY